MPTDSQDPSRAKMDARANRRWMIGIVITLLFGAFGVVMALLSYYDRDRSAPAGASSPSPSRSKEPAPSKEPASEPPPPASEPRDKGKGNNGKHDR